MFLLPSLKYLFLRSFDLSVSATSLIIIIVHCHTFHMPDTHTHTHYAELVKRVKCPKICARKRVLVNWKAQVIWLTENILLWQAGGRGWAVKWKRFAPHLFWPFVCLMRSLIARHLFVANKCHALRIYIESTQKPLTLFHVKWKMIYGNVNWPNGCDFDSFRNVSIWMQNQKREEKKNSVFGASLAKMHTINIISTE